MIGKITKCDEIKKEHTIQWQDGSDDADWVVDLMSCRKCTEWREVQAGEVISIVLSHLNGESESEDES